MESENKVLEEFFEINNTLKPCPFCGGKAEFDTFQHSYMQMYYIRCTKCGISTGTSHEKLSIQAKRWNRRVENEKFVTESRAREIAIEYRDMYVKEAAEKIYAYVNCFGTRNLERFKNYLKQFGVE